MESTPQVSQALLDDIAAIAVKAGEAIMAVYGREEIAVDRKGDDSPLTAADLAAHKIISAALAELTPDIPLLSEESEHIPWEVRRQWRRFWLVDPLDGTKEFINRNGEFTVNIALIQGGEPVLGAVHVPVTGVTYLGAREIGAWCERDGQRQPIRVRTISSPVVMVASRRHGAEQVEALEAEMRERFGPVTRTSMGSSLKLCLVAAGEADIYPRLAPTCEWDTGAAQAVVEAAGGVVVDTRLAPLAYQKENLLNPHFLVLGGERERWDFLPELLHA
ncbi:3'(2'),5'-bisphosphate nucleotidase CysQ [Alcanivorax quisquiliarum]|uniref:3'(2'),5'-bisphosphate nucleotidase CysQ n=1 Tax=Alcanivorax quisquiliarum TaxID=2933565 RepID=A0ABT0E5M7_9GAMM|nr:3'(2'),5'-bisphosphate nucleotidase CysQ [Alcanivorax quisquiliarum]